MPKLTLTANELVGTDADFVSLVKKGANRIPFRIIKEDQTDMIDLHSIAKTALAKSAAAPAKPAVLAVVVAKTDNMDSIKAALVAAGLSVEKAEEKDGITVFKQEGVSEANPQTMKLNDEVALIVTGMQKGFESWDWQSTSLKDMMSTEGFYPSMWLGLDLLGATMGNIMQKAETPAEATAQLTAAVDEFKGWLSGLSGSIPEHAFKAEQLLMANDWGDEEVEEDGKKTKKKTPKKKAAVTKEEVSSNPLFGNATSTAQQAVNDAGNIESNPAHGNETPHASGGKQPNPAGSDGNIEGAPVASGTGAPAASIPGGIKKEGEAETPADPNAALLAAIGTMIDTKLETAQKATNEAIGKVTTSVEKLDGQVKAVADRTQKMDVAINGTVDPGQQDDRRNHQQKSASKAPPLLDTGLRPNTH